MNKAILYLATAFVGLVMSYNTNIFPQSVSATEVPSVVIPPAITPGNFTLNLDLETGNSIVESNLPIASTDITVNHPTKIVEKVVTKPIKVPVYETKTEYREKVVMFKIVAPTPKLHVPCVELPNKVQ